MFQLIYFTTAKLLLGIYRPQLSFVPLYTQIKLTYDGTIAKNRNFENGPLILQINILSEIITIYFLKAFVHYVTRLRQFYNPDCMGYQIELFKIKCSITIQLLIFTLSVKPLNPDLTRLI